MVIKMVNRDEVALYLFKKEICTYLGVICHLREFYYTKILQFVIYRKQSSKIADLLYKNILQSEKFRV